MRGMVVDAQAAGVLHGDMCFLEAPSTSQYAEGSTLTLTGDVLHGVGVLLVFAAVVSKQDAGGLSLHSQVRTSHLAGRFAQYQAQHSPCAWCSRHSGKD